MKCGPDWLGAAREQGGRTRGAKRARFAAEENGAEKLTSGDTSWQWPRAARGQMKTGGPKNARAPLVSYP